MRRSKLDPIPNQLRSRSMSEITVIPVFSEEDSGRDAVRLPVGEIMRERLRTVIATLEQAQRAIDPFVQVSLVYNAPEHLASQALKVVEEFRIITDMLRSCRIRIEIVEQFGISGK
jgi:hypothetical protein